MPLIITITDAGRAEIINAENTGTTPVLLTEIGFGDGQYIPDPAQTTLQNEIKRINTISGQVVADDTIHVTVQDASSDTYNVGEFGIYTDGGTLFAVFSQAASSGWIIEKSGVLTLLLAADVIFSDINAASLAFGDVSFLNPPASETVQGVVEIATPEEVQTGTDNTRAITPAGLASTFTAANVLAKLKTVDGPGSELDADQLDGKEGFEYLMPSGAISMFARSTPPTGWLKANGAAISRTVYASLFAAIGTQFGAGDGATTFNLPDLRGEFLRGWDDGRSIDSGRVFGSWQGDQNQSHNHGVNDPGHAHAVPLAITSGVSTTGIAAHRSDGNNNDGYMTTQNSPTYISINFSGGSESRPRNLAMLTCIKY